MSSKKFMRPGGNATRSCTLPLTVVDSSAIIEVLLKKARSAPVREALSGHELIAPDLLNVEVLHVLRRMEHTGEISSQAGSRAVRDFARLVIDRVPTETLLTLVWAFRANLTAYDACYVALAKQWRCPLLTLDKKLTKAPRLGIQVLTI